MKKFTRILICVMAAACLITACGKKPASNTHTGSVKPGSNGSTNKEPQTTSNLKVHISDIVSYAGDEIDYIGAIQSAENMEVKRSMIYVDSSAVDTNTPGTYLAEYSFDYLGSTVTSTIKVTILANPNATTTSAEEETSTEPTTESSENTSNESTEEPSEATQEPSIPDSEHADPNRQTSNAEEYTPSDPEGPPSTEPVEATVEQMLPDANITLSNGKVVTVKCTSNRYIVETFTDETYFEEDGFTFLTSELKVLFNTGDIQVIETVVTRVEPQNTTEPETTTSTQ